MKKWLFLILLSTFNLCYSASIPLTIINGSTLLAPSQATIILKQGSNGLLSGITYTLQCQIINNNIIGAQLMYATTGITRGGVFLNNIQQFTNVFVVPANPTYNYRNIFLINNVKLTSGVTYANLTFTNQCNLCNFPLTIQNCIATEVG